MSLKTLKDIYEDAPTPNHNIEAYNRMLKQEAIKHIENNETVEPMPEMIVPTSGNIKFPKRVNELIFEKEKIEVSDKELVKCMEVLDGWIKYFFNITKEDLK